MGVGIGIGLLAIGLVLALALAVGNAVEGVDLVLIGWILAGVGALGIVVALITTAQRLHQTIEHVTRDETGSQTGRAAPVVARAGGGQPEPARAATRSELSAGAAAHKPPPGLSRLRHAHRSATKRRAC